MCGTAALQREHRVHVHREGLFPFLVRNVLDCGKRLLVCGIVDQDVDAPERLDRGGDDHTRVRGVADVARYQDRLAAGIFDQPLGFGGVIVLAQIADQHVRALACEGERDRPADPAVAAGHDRLAVVQPTIADIAVLAVVGTEVHLLGRAGDRLLLLGKRRLWSEGHARVLVLECTHKNRCGEAFRPSSFSGRFAHRHNVSY
jgi:hypothetical protein